VPPKTFFGHPPMTGRWCRSSETSLLEVVVQDLFSLRIPSIDGPSEVVTRRKSEVACLLPIGVKSCSIPKRRPKKQSNALAENLVQLKKVGDWKQIV